MAEAHEQIRSLLGRYCEAIDLGDFEAVGGLFGDGSLATEDGTVLAAGSEDVAAFYRRGTKLHGSSPRTKHLTLNTVIDVAPDGRTATARSSYVVLQATAALPLQPIIAGRYLDTFRCDGGSWRFAERRFVVDLVGDLSDHLVRPLG